ncbi:HAD family hydrolase [Promicromonospora xylanilytica]
MDTIHDTTRRPSDRRTPPSNPPTTCIGPGARLVALDIDGTLLRTGQPPSAQVIAAVRGVVDAGHNVVLATGRSLAGALPVVKRLGLRSGWVVCSNGAVVARVTHRRGLTVEQTLTFDPVLVLQRAMAAFPDVYLAVEDVGRGWNVNVRFPDGLLNGRQHVVRRERDLWEAPVVRAALHAADIGPLATDLGWLAVTATPAGPHWVDVTPVGISKATSLEKIRIALGLARGATWAVGDGANDADMLRWAGTGIAMGHASDDLKTLADDVAGTIDNDGVVEVLQQVVAR